MSRGIAMKEPAFSDYKLELRPLPTDEGGGYVASIPQLPGCRGDGETPEEAMKDLRDAFSAWIDTARSMGRDIPKPGADGKPVAALVRFPRSLHEELTEIAD